jgi:hypothetical protein
MKFQRKYKTAEVWIISWIKSHSRKSIKKRSAGAVRQFYDACKIHVGADVDFIRKSITSDVLSQEELDYLIERKCLEHQATIADRVVNSNTITGSIVGVFIGSLLGSILLITCSVILERIAYFALVGVFIISYQSIKFITKQSRNNAVVFVASFVATVSDLLIVMVAARLFIN